jgi:PAS domain S-box-containing protein
MARDDHDVVQGLLERMSDAFVCLDRDWRYTYVNRKAGEIFGRDPASLIGKHIWTEFPEGVGQPFHRAYERAVAEGTFQQLEAYYPPWDKWFENRIHPDAEGLLIFFNDVTARHLEQARLRVLSEMVVGERRALAMLAAGAPVREIVTGLIEVIEEVFPGALGSTLLLDSTGTRVYTLAAPRLPDAYNRAIDGLEIGPRAGSCGTAAFRGEPVLVGDTETDPLWEAYRDVARPHGLRACSSWPILASDGKPLGTFAIYFREPRLPDDDMRDLVARAAHVAGIVIERRGLDDRLRALADRSEEIREDERTGIAREIHDHLGQALTALKMDIAWVARRLSEPLPLRAKLAEMARDADDVIASIRRISAELRPGILDDLGLQAAIEWHAEEFAARTGIRCRVEAALDVPVERRQATAVYRIFQEALTNIARHAGATQVDVELVLDAGGRLRLDISDDGVGLSNSAESGLGLLGMRERARRVGGECLIRSREPRGTAVSLRIPLRSAAERP